MKAEFKIGGETKIKDMKIVKQVIEEMQYEDNLESVVDTLTIVKRIFTFGNKIPGTYEAEKIPHEISSYDILGPLTIEVTYVEFEYQICASMLFKGEIDGKKAIAEICNYAKWKNGWLEFETDECEREVHALAIYFEAK